MTSRGERKRYLANVRSQVATFSLESYNGAKEKKKKRKKKKKKKRQDNRNFRVARDQLFRLASPNLVVGEAVSSITFTRVVTKYSYKNRFSNQRSIDVRVLSDSHLSA